MKKLIAGILVSGFLSLLYFYATPKEAPVYETYLKKLSDQEKELDALTAKQTELMKAEHDAKKSYEDFLGDLSA